ncbi:YybH family protein [Dokdonella fugitiva]|uniref:Uncharacterized protein (TIGR02246 family) n=1 Tax=Dokdonella fugitiva TaxID=328517 RepID=A0A4R2IB18_9GAMM|nr:SgcJ/EcaC family oxidoreductase [Dokdonella fugitiva]MBA8885227.1 uncharacterized protein (TIGR02246 family) [Dokdonella fugitiva]TCO41684.1 uncharacterized protein (TIGR02246 family) [Dokdonella fugitiva]
MNAPADPLREVLARYAQAVLAKDADAFAAAYTDDVVVFDAWGTWSLRGIDAWRSVAAGWFASLGDERVVVGVEEGACTAMHDLAFGHAMLTYAALSPDGTPLRSLMNRVTYGLRRVDGEWKIAHEHTSAPIDHATGKAILHR